MATLITRRAALGAIAGASMAMLLGATGCSGSKSGSSTSTGNGFASDCDVRDYPVSLTFDVDKNLKYFLDKAGTPRLDTVLAKYQQQKNRDQVSISFNYLPYADMIERSTAGFTGADAAIGFQCTVDDALAAGTLQGGSARSSVRNFNTAFSVQTHVVTSAASPKTMPAARTVNGKDASDGSINQLQQIGTIDGMLAVCNPRLAAEGVAANKLLYQAKLYSSETGFDGEYTGDLAGRVSVFDSQDAAMAAVASGACDFGFAFTASLASRFPQVTDCYTPSGATNMVFSGAVTADGNENGVARDFMQYLSTYSG